MSNGYTVIGYYEESGQIFAHHVEAESQLNAFAKVSAEHEDAVMVCVITGDVEEGEELGFPGWGTVSAATILEQPDVYGSVDDDE